MRTLLLGAGRARVPDGPIAVAALAAGAAALLVAAAVHAAQLVSIFHAVPWIGPLFAADAVVSAALAVVLVLTRRRVVAGAGALVSAGALAGLAASSTVGLFGWSETALRPAVVLAIGAEGIAVAALLALAMAPRRVPGRVDLAGGLAAAGLAAVAGPHLAAAPEEWADTRGLAWLFVALAVGCLAVAGLLVLGGRPWAAVLALAVLPAAGYVLSRWTGLPGATDDVGDWTDALGLASLAVEVPLAALAAARVGGRSAGDDPRRSGADRPLRWLGDGLDREGHQITDGLG